MCLPHLRRQAIGVKIYPLHLTDSSDMLDSEQRERQKVFRQIYHLFMRFIQIKQNIANFVCKQFDFFIENLKRLKNFLELGLKMILVLSQPDTVKKHQQPPYANIFL